MKLIKEKFVIFLIRPDVGKLYLSCYDNDTIKYNIRSLYKFSSDVMFAVKFDTQDEACLIRDIIDDDMCYDLQVEKQLFSDDVHCEV